MTMYNSTLKTQEQAALKQSGVPQPLVIELHNGAMRIAKHARLLRVISGTAWLTTGSQDVILHVGEQTQISPAGVSVIEAMRGQRLVFEVW